jgi:hypothetical protein
MGIIETKRRSKITATEPCTILQERSGKVIGSSGKALGFVGSGRSIPTGNFLNFSGGFQSLSCAFRREPVGNHRKKPENFPVGILLPWNLRMKRNRPFRSVLFDMGTVGFSKRSVSENSGVLMIDNDLNELFSPWTFLSFNNHEK